ncbi:hypothetical protein [Salibacterium qingdaonense]|uniref:Phage head-tail adaptor, putative, SPP1 family n=1 Tax=Salibacterium qingdaonense TaxID=266892 RepID=A0A1I4Q7H7_9BACI|nr:hypothetical protein [Salibacterium qingdaonense]SFM35756.1 hypothetical protein SAMN04488054_13732 [Salibacterium qingdaonense]
MMYEYSGLVSMYEGPYEVYEITSEGYRDYENGGEWVEGTGEWVEKMGALFPMNSRELQFSENGTYTTEDRILFAYESHQPKQLVRWNGVIYRINAEDDLSAYTDIFMYMLKKKEPVANAE